MNHKQTIKKVEDNPNTQEIINFLYNHNAWSRRFFNVFAMSIKANSIYKDPKTPRTQHIIKMCKKIKKKTKSCFESTHNICDMIRSFPFIFAYN